MGKDEDATDRELDAMARSLARQVLPEMVHQQEGQATALRQEARSLGEVRMTWLGWTQVAIYAVTALAVVANIGRASKPTTHATAVIIVVYTALMILAILTIGTGSGL